MGAIFRFDPGRGDLFKVRDKVVRRLHRIDAAAEAGGFVEATLPLSSNGSDAPTMVTARVSAVQGFSGGHDGALIEGSMGVIIPADAWTLGGSVTTSFIDRAYANAYYGVTGPDAVASRLKRFTAGSGFRDVGVGVFANRPVSDRLSVGGVASYTCIVGEAARSPVVGVRGSRDQFFVGLTLTYRGGKAHR